jgi:hypothetical protein
MMDYHFRKAEISEIPQIWDILQFAIIRRKEDGSDQWQDGYPNPAVVQKDIEKGEGFVLTEEKTIVGYSAVLINDEPQYAKIEGKWLTNDDFVVFHRVAISEKYLGKGCALKIFEKLGYTFCGKVYFRGGQRKAFEKVLAKPF